MISIMCTKHPAGKLRIKMEDKSLVIECLVCGDMKRYAEQEKIE